MRFYNREKELEVLAKIGNNRHVSRIVWLEPKTEMKGYRTEYRLLSLEDVMD